MKKIFFIILLSLNVIGDEFKIDLEISSKEAILDEPINVCIEAEYIGGEKITIAEDAFTLEIIIEKTNGEVLKKKIERKIEIIKSPYNKFKEIEKGWKKKICEDISSKYYIDLGGYYIWGRAISEGPYNEKVGNTIREKKAWEGQIESEKRNILVKYPEGKDREAYEYFKNSKYKGVPLVGEGSKEVLAKFPSSTYAGWVLTGGVGWGNWDKIDIEAKYKDSLKRGMEYKVKDRVVKLPDLSEYGLERIKKINEYLKNVPDFSLKDRLLFEVAYWYMYIGEYKKSYEKAKEIMKEGKGIGYEKAKELYDLLKKEKSIKE